MKQTFKKVFSHPITNILIDILTLVLAILGAINFAIESKGWVMNAAAVLVLCFTIYLILSLIIDIFDLFKMIFKKGNDIDG